MRPIILVEYRMLHKVAAMSFIYQGSNKEIAGMRYLIRCRFSRCGHKC